MEKICKKSSNRKSEFYHQILYIQNSLGTKLQLKLTILNLLTKSIKNGHFQSQKEKNENRHQILHIQISLGSKFRLQQTILIFSEQTS